MPAIRASGKWFTTAERVCVAGLFGWLIWLPLPFGSNVEIARRPLLAGAFVLCAVAACIRLAATRHRSTAPPLPRAWRIWAIGGLLLVGIGIAQLIPMPSSLLRLLSPASAAIWQDASSVAAFAGTVVSTNHPISVDPAATVFELFRIAALLAAFFTSSLLIRTHERRLGLAWVLTVSALFQTVYGVRAAASGHYAIWGWVNTLIFDRVTGTFVNPNHFAHYAAIALPVVLFIAAAAWRDAAPPHVPLRLRLVRLFESRLVPFTAALLAAVGCLAAILLAQSRGGLLALGTGILIVGTILPGRRAAKIAFAAAAAILVVVAMVWFLGADRTVKRLGEAQDAQSAWIGRRIGLRAALDTWRMFPVLGSGLGTFERVVAISQREGAGHVYHHAHDDYLEVAATAGTLGFVIAVVALGAGAIDLARMTVGAAGRTLRWKRRAFQVAALGSLTIAMVHAFFDFNFFIPVNPATLAVILGAAVAVTDHDLRKRDKNYDDSATRR